MSQEELTTPPALQTVTGIVVEALPNTMFRVECEIDGEKRLIIAYMAGKMKLHRIRVIPGDKVEIVLAGYGQDKGRITRRN